MMSLSLFTLWFIVPIGAHAISVGVIYNASLITSSPNMTINETNCTECLCALFNSSISSLNCLANNNDNVICQLFSDGIYRGLNYSQMRINLNSTFYFGLTNSSEIATTQVMTSISVTTVKETTTTTTTTTTITTTTTTATTTRTTTTTTTSSTTTPACSATGHGTLAFFDGVPLSWTQYRYNITANKTAYTLMFGFQGDGSGKRFWFLDEVSVVDVTEPGIQLLQNPSFESSTTQLTGWNLYCTSTCPSGSINGGHVALGGNCSTNNCYADHCYGSGAIDFLSQTFQTAIGHVYTISFWIIDWGSGGNGNTQAYADLY